MNPKHSKPQLIAVALAVSLGAATALAQHAGHRTVTPADLKWEDVPSLPPGAKIAMIEGVLSEPALFTARVRFPANYSIPAHWHPTVERITVLSGTFNLGTGGKLDRNRTTALGPGSLTIMQPKMHHFVWTSEETVVQLNGYGPWGITYVNPADDPRKK